MNVFKTIQRHRGGRRVGALLSVVVLLSNGFLAVAQTTAKSQPSDRISEEQRIVHVLNRLGFGPRPGDVERVRQTGLERYIEQQLNPGKLDDPALEAKLKNLTTLTLSNGELLAKYPNPGQLLRQLQRRGQLPPELAALVNARQKGQAVAAKTQAGANDADAEKTMSEAMSATVRTNPTAGRQSNKNQAAATQPGEPGLPGGVDDNPERRAYRRAIMAYMQENGLQPPQRIMAELQASRILRAVYSERQLQEQMVDFWTNHFNVYAQKGADRWFLTSYDRDVIRPNALGNFRDLLEQTAKSPAMLFYLDNFQSVSPNAQAGRGAFRRMMQNNPDAMGQARRGGLFGDGRRGRMRDRQARQAQQQRQQPDAMKAPQGQTAQQQRPPQKRPKRGINENYARELMELHTLGVDGGYTQKDVQEVARCFTGWTIIDPRGYLGGSERAGTFVFNPRLHDDGEKIVLGQKIPPGGGIKDGEMVLDILLHHPSTAKFIATKLSRRFVMDNPTPQLIGRIADAFLKSNGDIKTTLRAVFSSPEFNSTEARRAKIKTPFELAVSAIRILGAETNGGPALHQWIARMGEPLYGYQAPTGYPDKAEYWVSTGALLERLNFALALVGNRIPNTRVDLSRFVGEEATSSRAVNQERIVDQFLNLVLQGDISPKSKAVLLRQLSTQASAPITATPADVTANIRNVSAAPRQKMQEGATVGNPEVTRIAALVIGSPEFQRQ
ncbi:MAG: DUF1800 domain-containing protein [Acidobacteria bacterium]|nr:DUF1800 domain-containing protein [Acidobacteriota bacterium]